jgi:hypothetical protein
MTLAMAIELESTGIKVNAASPGFTRTNLNNYAGTQAVEEGAREPVRLALLGPDGPTGTFLQQGRRDPVVISFMCTHRSYLCGISQAKTTALGGRGSDYLFS